jgi:hypothetical protein
MVIQSGPAGEVFEIIVQQPEGAPDKVIAHGCSRPSRETAIPPGPLTDAQKKGLIDQLLDRLVADDRFSGVVMVAKAGQPVYERATGMASQSYGVPNRLDTKFCLGSMNKMFTRWPSPGCGQDGQLKYGDTGTEVPPRLPEHRRPQEGDHPPAAHPYSGLGSYFEDPSTHLDWTRMRHVRDYTTCVAAESLAFEPGARNELQQLGLHRAGTDHRTGDRARLLRFRP